MTAVKEKKTEGPAIADDPVRAKWKEESKMVKGIFRCHEPAGGSVTFPFKKFKWDPVVNYTMTDGQEYEIPLAVARHLNKNCNYPIHSYILDSAGKPLLDQAGKKFSRMNFDSLDFF